MYNGGKVCMTSINSIQRNLIEHIEVVELVRETCAGTIDKIGAVLAQSLSDGCTLFWCGNGGSAADSQHLAAELVGRFRKNRRALRSIALTTDTSVLTCVGNDYSFDDIFSRQVEALGREGDVFIGISTSGESENVLRALRVASELGMVTVALLGKKGGHAQNLAQYSLVVPSESTARIQEVHIIVGHILCELIEERLGVA